MAAGREGVVGLVTYASGENMKFTDPQEYLRTVREELPAKDVTGFRFETLTDDPMVRKAVDDMVYDLYGEENPRPLEDYMAHHGQVSVPLPISLQKDVAQLLVLGNQPRQGPAMGDIST